ncbi:Hypothetical protein KVN_LOCUS98 [uncultured virus]|nr:Hypothetical protein KVN_LOCUS98 [uncultured virus]
MDNIIPASEISSIIEENRKKKDIEINEIKTIKIKKITECSEAYFNIIIKFCAVGIDKLKNGTNKSIKISELNGDHIFNGIPSHVLHYGHYKGKNNFTSRKEDFECERPFIRAQKILLEKGYYLLDESDPSVGFKMIIKLYCEKPNDLQTRKSLWHGLNLPPKL